VTDCPTFVFLQTVNPSKAERSMELAPTDIKGCIMTRVGILARALAFPVIQKNSNHVWRDFDFYFLKYFEGNFLRNM
jgi:hypothetical protein